MDKQLFYEIGQETTLIKFKKKIQNSPIIRTKSRASVILSWCIGLTIEIYTGRNYTRLYITENMVGKKLGEFAFTRKLGQIHKIKKNYKKNKNK
jgi:ribosomal protein S19